MNTIEDRLAGIEAMLARIDERTAHFSSKITQQENAIESLKRRSWMTSGITAFLVWLVAEWQQLNALFNRD